MEYYMNEIGKNEDIMINSRLRKYFRSAEQCLENRFK